MNTYFDILNKKSISPSIQRIKILEFLEKNRTHPTIEEIYTALKKDIPTLSKMTVYNTLNLFVEKKLVKSININGNITHYDILEHNHAHLFCNNCKKILDIKITCNIENCLEDNNYKINDTNIILFGLCQKCKIKLTNYQNITNLQKKEEK